MLEIDSAEIESFLRQLETQYQGWGMALQWSEQGALRKLLSHGVVEEVGRHESAGRPILYGTTTSFLQQFGLSGVAELSPLDDEIELLENEKK